MGKGHPLEHETPNTQPVNNGVVGFLIGPAFLALAVLMLVMSSGDAIPTEVTPAVRSISISTESLRVPMSDPPFSLVNGFERRCNDCHGIFESRDNSQADIRQHTEITLSHGLNDNCYNCHDREDRERLVMHDGSTIGYAHSEDLCAQCHGRVYLDWTRGAHGKTVGSWDPKNEAFGRLTCAQCHNPHSPMFDKIGPLPGPNTLRMGDPDGDSHSGGGKRDPLLHWSEGGGDHGAHADDGAHDGGHD